MEQDFQSQPPQDSNINIAGVEVDMMSREHLKTITTWARIVSIVGLISAGLTLLRMFASGNGNALALVGIGIVAVIYVTIMVILYLFLLRFATRTAESLNTQNQDQFNSGIGNLANYFKMLGILIIIGLSFGIIFFLAIMGGSAYR